MRIKTIILLSLLIVAPISAQTNTGSLNLKSILKDIKSNDQKTEKPKIEKPKQDSISEIKVKGNKSIPKNIILNEVSFRIGDSPDAIKIARNIKNISALGLFSDVKHTLLKGPNGNVLTFIVVENPVIGEIQIQGNHAYSAEKIISLLKSRKGDILSRSYIRHDIQAVNNLYEENGFLNARVMGVTAPEKDNDPYIINLEEGLISEIVITGNNKTKDYVIRRELDIKPGMAVQSKMLQEDIRRIFNLNYFTNIIPDLQPDEKGGYKLVLDVKEKSTNGQFSFGGGYSPQSGFSLFSDLFWDNLLGTGQLILLKGQFGLGGNNSAGNSVFQFKYHNPWMWDKRKSFTLRTWITDGEQNLNFLNPGSVSNRNFIEERRKGIDVAIGLPIDYTWGAFHKLKYEDVTLKETEANYNVNSYTLGLTYDTRDIKFNPLNGRYMMASIEQSFLFNENSISFTRYDLNLKQFIQTFERQTIALNVNLGYLRAPNIDINSDQFIGFGYRVGLSDTVRGQNEVDLLFGNKKVVLSAEYRFLFNDIFSTVLFVDAGTATSGDLSSFPEFLVGKGVGIRFTIPGLGPLRFDYGFDAEGVGRVQINVGHAF